MEKEYKTYREAGVDVSAGDRCSQIAYRACLETHQFANRDIGDPRQFSGGFSGPVRIRASLNGDHLVKNCDGVGSKALVALRNARYDTLGHDLLAMNADDAAAIGAEPFLATNSLDVARADPALVEPLMEGLVAACRRAGVAMVGGEIAELPDQLKEVGETGGENSFIWNADLLGVLEEEKLIDGTQVEAGHKIVALRSQGIRSNGLTLAREICRSSLGDGWAGVDFGDETGRNWGDVLLTPSVICAPALVEMVGPYGKEGHARLTGVAHITGGGLSNLSRVLPEDLGASLEDLFRPQPEFRKLQEMGPVSDREAYETWNMGQAMLLVTPGPKEVIAIAREQGIGAQVCGEVTEETGVRVLSKGREGEELSF